MNADEYNWLVNLVTRSGDLEAARKLYLQAGRKEDWKNGMLAASLLRAAVPITPESVRTKSDGNYTDAMAATDNIDGVFSIGRVILMFNHQILEAKGEWFHEGYFEVPWVTDWVPFSMLERVTQMFRDAGWDINAHNHDGAAVVIWGHPGK